jgi:hypothetical protein
MSLQMPLYRSLCRGCAVSRVSADRGAGAESGRLVSRCVVRVGVRKPNHEQSIKTI